MLNFNSIMVGTMNMPVMAKFYDQVFDKKPDMVDEGGRGWTVGNCFFGLMEHSEAAGKSKEPARIMLDFETTQIQQDFDRIKAIEGAVVIKEPYQMGPAWIATLADPDGNYFQLMTPWEEQSSLQ